MRAAAESTGLDAAFQENPALREKCGRCDPAPGLRAGWRRRWTFRLVRLGASCLLVLLAGAAFGRDEAPPAKQFDSQVKPFIARHCLSCHSGEKPKGDFDLEKLRPDFTEEKARARWQGVLSRVKSGEMPPKG